MRPILGVVGTLLLLMACDPAADPPPDITAVTTTEADGPIRGALPDGTIYDVILDPPAQEPVTAVSAGVVEDGRVREVTFEREGGEWTTRAGMEVITHLGTPVVELPPGLEWADDDRVPMQVTYRTFAVRRGCVDTAVACNPTHAVGVVPLEGWSAGEATVVSYALRRPDDAHYLDPGPLPGQSGHDVVWTGREMIVWGGTAPPRTDGAAYHPATDTWRMLPPAPLEAGRPTRAVWAGTALVVVSEEATVAYRPNDHSWTAAAEGMEPPPPGGMVWTGEEVVAWTDDAIRALRDGRWAEFGRPVEEGVLRVMDGRLLAVGPQACQERAVHEWSNDRWEKVTSPPLPDETCPLPHQTAAVAGRIVTWREGGSPTFVYDLSTDRWERADPAPLRSIDRPSGPLVMDGRLLVARGQEGALFDPVTGSWETVELPGHGTDATMVWTGEEVLMWDRCCYEPDDVDAWHWAPP